MQHKHKLECKRTRAQQGPSKKATGPPTSHIKYVSKVANRIDSIGREAVKRTQPRKQARLQENRMEHTGDRRQR